MTSRTKAEKIREALTPREPYSRPRIIKVFEGVPGHEPPVYKVYYGGYQETFRGWDAYKQAKADAARLYRRAKAGLKAGYESAEVEARRMQQWIERQQAATGEPITPEQFERAWGTPLDLPPGVAVIGTAYAEGRIQLKTAPRPYAGPLSLEAIEQYYGVEFAALPAGLRITGVQVGDEGAIQLQTRLRMYPAKAPLTETAIEAYYGMEITNLPPGVKISKVWLAGGPEGEEVKIGTEPLPYSGPLTEEAIEQYYGVQIPDLAPGLQISRISVLEGSIQVEAAPLPYTGPLTEEAIEQYYGLSDLQLPEEASILGVSMEAGRVQVQYQTPVEQIAEEVVVAPQDISPGDYERLAEEAGLPAGAVITNVEVTEEGVKISYELPWQQTSLSGHIFEETPGVPAYVKPVTDILGAVGEAWKATIKTTLPQLGSFLFPERTPEEQRRYEQFQDVMTSITKPELPFQREATAGFVASFESWITEAPSLSSALIGSLGATLVERKLTATPELERYRAAGPAYWVGNISGEILQTLLLSKAIGYMGGKVWEKLPKRVTYPIEKAAAKATIWVEEKLAKVPGIRKLPLGRVERISEIGEFETRLLTPDELISYRMTQIGTEFHKVSLEEARFLREMYQALDIRSIEAGGSQLTKTMLRGTTLIPPGGYYFRSASLVYRPAAPYLAAMEGTKQVLTTMRIAPETAYLVPGMPHAAVKTARHFTAVAFWGQLQPEFVQKLLGKATTTAVAGGMTQMIGAEALMKAPAITHVSTILTPAIKTLGTTGVASLLIGAAKPTVAVREKTEIVQPRITREIMTASSVLMETEKQAPQIAEIPAVDLRTPVMSLPKPGVIPAPFAALIPRPGERAQEVPFLGIAERPYTADMPIPGQISELIVPPYAPADFGTPSIPLRPWDEEMVPLRPGFRGKRKEQWYLKTHPILDPSELAQRLMSTDTSTVWARNKRRAKRPKKAQSRGKPQVFSIRGYILGTPKRSPKKRRRKR